MKTNRLIGKITIKNGIAVQSFNFNSYLPIGRPEIVSEYLGEWGIDEILISFIDSENYTLAQKVTILEKVIKNCYVPLTIAGGIKNTEEANTLIHHGADKISLNHVITQNPSIIPEFVSLLGSQCILGNITYTIDKDGTPKIYDYKSSKTLNLDFFKFIEEIQSYGIGELVLNNVDRDGSLEGIDLITTREVANFLKIPLIATGGIGSPEHILEALTTSKVEAIAIGNMLNYSEHSITTIKTALRQRDLKTIRIENKDESYQVHSFNEIGRVNKINDQYLEELLFTKIIREEI